MDDEVFRALADPTRRSLLDALFERDGQTLSALEQHVPMTRFGVMKHLRLLEKAGLVVTKRMGREKLHFLNPIPIRRIYERWVNKYTDRWAVTLTSLKRQLEEEPMEQIYVPHQVPLVPSPGGGAMAVFEIYIKTTPERLWQAIIDPKMRAKYSFGVEVHSEWTPGSRYLASVPGGIDSAKLDITEGENLEVDPPRRLVQSFRALWSDEVKAAGFSRVTWEIIPVGDSCRLTVIHDRLPEDANPELYGGWPMVLSGLKTLLETGERLTTPGSLLYSEHNVQIDNQS
ncbi:ArsR/SmtB family transcription factor [Rhizobium sp. 2YAF20]|uniref:ArsR/SmtB family transcription factor n=1 Tax=Rhizobium sp. 2YAF20 TaxID=3233027 RepID=UPI003F9AFA14